MDDPSGLFEFYSSDRTEEIDHEQTTAENNAHDKNDDPFRLNTTAADGLLSTFRTFARTKLSHLIEHGLQGFIVKNIEGESTEANDLSHIL